MDRTVIRLASQLWHVAYRTSVGYGFKFLSGPGLGGDNRVVHSWHFWSIFHSFFIHFFLKIETENEWKMNKKWNPNLAVAKMDPENDHFSTFWQCCLEGKMHFYSIFLSFPFQGHGVHGNHFSHHFWFPFVCFSAKYMKMSQKWVWKWAKNGPKMATVNNPIKNGFTIIVITWTWRSYKQWQNTSI